MKSLVIIGGGISGLSAGVFGSKAGFNCLILEKNSVPGGYATMMKWKDYKLELSVHGLFGMDPGSYYNSLF